ncbi:hypothetical protein [Arsenicicoccus dermatophilus]|uniref:hypothetical protein n=1 Tax=Arsenicicoccus dermatophilus TaxID=1076331 RepID=UPI001F4C575B|nr:hypothetical protein [Arsenicicoccus dermatophilus]MCH8612191.1 hypothetical protein [Arsenicicoccus dermatophilus]
MSPPSTGPRPALSLVPGDPDLTAIQADDELLDTLGARALDASLLADPVTGLLGGWVDQLDENLPPDLRPEEIYAPSRRTVLVSRVGVAAGVAALVLGGGAVAAAATGGGLGGFMSKAHRAVEQGIAAPRPVDPAVLATADLPTSSLGDGHAVRRALVLAQQRLVAGDRDGAAAVVALIEAQVGRDPSLLDDGDRTLLATVRHGLGSDVEPAVLARPAPSSEGESGRGPDRASSPGRGAGETLETDRSSAVGVPPRGSQDTGAQPSDGAATPPTEPAPAGPRTRPGHGGGQGRPTTSPTDRGHGRPTTTPRPTDPTSVPTTPAPTPGPTTARPTTTPGRPSPTGRPTASPTRTPTAAPPTLGASSASVVGPPSTGGVRTVTETGSTRGAGPAAP